MLGTDGSSQRCRPPSVASSGTLKRLMDTMATTNGTTGRGMELFRRHPIRLRGIGHCSCRLPAFLESLVDDISRADGYAQ